MNRKKAYLLLQAVACILTAGLLMAGAIGIYREGAALHEAGDYLAQIYSAENIARAFQAAAPVLFISIGIGIAGLILGVKDEEAEKPVPDPESSRDMIAALVQTPSAGMLDERARQKKLKAAGWTAFFVCMIPAAVYLVNPAHFHADTAEADFLALMRGIGPWILAGMICLVIAHVLVSRSLVREAGAAKQQLAKERQDSRDSQKTPSDEENRENHEMQAGRSGMTEADKVGGPAVKQSSRRWVNIVRAAVLAAAAVCIIAGVMNGSMTDVLVKASVICSECIGLG